MKLLAKHINIQFFSTNPSKILLHQLRDLYVPIHTAAAYLTCLQLCVWQ